MRLRRRSTDELRREVDRLREVVDRKDQRIAGLQRRLDGRTDLGYLFVVTYGRSGSTLLNGILNDIPGYLLRGENGDALHHLFHFHTTLVDRKAEHAGARSPERPWFGIAGFDPDRSLAGLRRLVLETVLRPGPDTRVTGFKEIRWARKDLPAYAAWLRQVFPGARFIVNTRSHEAVLASKWWADADPESATRRLADAEEQILALADDLGDAAYRVHYDDYVADPDVLAGLFAWLGEDYDAARVRAVMEKRHSY